jgi:hypothetical protein
MTHEEILEAIAASGAAMAVLDSAACAVEEAQPAETNADGTLKPGGYEAVPARTLGDLVREALA